MRLRGQQKGALDSRARGVSVPRGSDAEGLCAKAGGALERQWCLPVKEGPAQGSELIRGAPKGDDEPPASPHPLSAS